jgi:hypothetical protein
MRVDCGQLDPGAVTQPIRGEWHPRMLERLDEEELADWRAGRCDLSASRADHRRSPRGRRRFDRFLANRCRRQDGQYAGFVRLDRRRRIGNRLHVEFRFRREKRLGGVACAHHLFAIIAAKLALLLMAMRQELLGQVGYSPI